MTFTDPDATLLTVGCAGCAGAPTMTALDGTDAGPVPRLFVAVTLHVYVLAVVRPATVIGPAVAPVSTPVLVTPVLLDVQVAVNSGSFDADR